MITSIFNRLITAFRKLLNKLVKHIATKTSWNYSGVKVNLGGCAKAQFVLLVTENSQRTLGSVSQKCISLFSKWKRRISKTWPQSHTQKPADAHTAVKWAIRIQHLLCVMRMNREFAVMIMTVGQLDGLESKTIHMLLCPMSLRSLRPFVCLSILIQTINFFHVKWSLLQRQNGFLNHKHII